MQSRALFRISPEKVGCSQEFLVRAQKYKRNQGLDQLLLSYSVMRNVSDRYVIFWTGAIKKKTHPWH